MLVGLKSIISNKMIILFADEFFQSDIGQFTILLVFVEITFDYALFDYYINLS